jgi:hypothetical protein
MREISRVPAGTEGQDEQLEEEGQAAATFSPEKPVFVRTMALVPARRIASVAFEYREDGTIRFTLLTSGGKPAATAEMSDCVLKPEMQETIRALAKSGLGLR